jgi:hypothetical protein
MQVIDDLTVSVKTAKRRADKRTSFEKAQQRLARIYNRPAYQHTVTALLVVVGPPASILPLPCGIKSHTVPGMQFLGSCLYVSRCNCFE